MHIMGGTGMPDRIGFSLKNTPKALANFSPGFERSDNPGNKYKNSVPTLKGLGMCAINPFRVGRFFRIDYPGFSLRSNPGLKLANAFGVFV